MSELWTIEDIASFLKKSRTTVYARVVTIPDFPKAIRLPSAGGKRLHPLWKAEEIFKWVEKYQK
jgi:predicted DNA-binding transcriptional regulator AlpA